MVTVRDINGCGESQDFVYVIDYPKYFTPNGDGYHDNWNIIGPQIDSTTMKNLRLIPGKQSSFFSAGALFTTLLIILNSYLFGLYIENFSTYNELYGSIGALLILLFYFWLNANIILLGHELNSSLQLLKKKCTT